MSVGDSKCFSRMWLGRYPDGSLPLGVFPPRRASCLSKAISQLSGQALISFLPDHIVAKIGNIAFASNSTLKRPCGGCLPQQGELHSISETETFR